MENSTLTRYQLVRRFINVITIGLVIAWYMNQSRLIAFGLPYLSDRNEVSDRIVAALSPMLLLVFWPLREVLVRAVAGQRANEPVASTRDLRSMMLPALGTTLFLWALTGIGYEVFSAYKRIYYMTGSDQFGWLHVGGMFAQILGSNEYSLLEWAAIAGAESFFDLFMLLIGIPLILKHYRRARHQALAHPIDSLPFAPLTRFEVTRVYIHIVVISIAVYWCCYSGLNFVGYLSHISKVGTGFITSGLLSLFVPIIVFMGMILPLASLLAHAMNGDEGREAVETPDQLRPLLVPMAAFAALIWSLLGLREDISFFLRMYEIFSGSFLSHMLVGWLILLWPFVKYSLLPAFIIYPSIRDMARSMKNRA